MPYEVKKAQSVGDSWFGKGWDDELVLNHELAVVVHRIAVNRPCVVGRSADLKVDCTKLPAPPNPAMAPVFDEMGSEELDSVTNSLGRQANLAK